MLIRPTDLKPLILVGVVPFLLGSLAYVKAASDKFPVKASTLIGLVVVLIVATFTARTFFHPSDSYFSSKGLLFFGLKPVTMALYIATLSVSFLPAIRAVASVIKDKAMRSVMGISLMILYIRAIILVSASDNTLLLVNGVVLSLALLAL